MSPILQSLANGSARGYGAFFGAAAAPAFESIASASGTGSSGTITFSSIPSTYQHLQIRGLIRGTTSIDTTYFTLQINGNAATAGHRLRGDGVNVTAAATNLPIYFPCDLVSANIMGVCVIDLHDYANTTGNKTVRYFGGWNGNNAHTTNERLQLSSSFLDNTAAVSSISLIANGVSWTTNTTFALYGIKGA